MGILHKRSLICTLSVIVIFIETIGGKSPWYE